MYDRLVKWLLLVGLLAGSCAHRATAEADRDGDGVPDSVDLCPDEPEDIDGDEDADGCPDADCDDCCSFITQRSIGFRPGESQIAVVARAAVDHVADELRTRADVLRVEIRGAAPDGDARLAKARATAVRDALVARGVVPDRLIAVAAAGARPAVGFRILESTCLPGG